MVRPKGKKSHRRWRGQNWEDNTHVHLSILTDEYLRALDEDNNAIPGVYAIGDNAVLKDGPSLPATAQGVFGTFSPLSIGARLIALSLLHSRGTESQMDSKGAQCYGWNLQGHRQTVLRLHQQG